VRRTTVACAAVAAALGLGLAACAGTDHQGAAGAGPASPAKIAVTGAYVPMPASPDMAVAYFDINNSGGTADQLLSVSAPTAQSAEMDQSTATSMSAITGGVTVPAHGSALFARDGKHVMLMGLSPAPVLGHRIELLLTFRQAGTITVQATVQPLTYQPAS